MTIIDPDTILAAIYQDIVKVQQAPNTDEFILNTADLINHVETLFDWLTRGGPSPAAWRVKLNDMDEEMRNYVMKDAIRRYASELRAFGPAIGRVMTESASERDYASGEKPTPDAH